MSLWFLPGATTKKIIDPILVEITHFPSRFIKKQVMTYRAWTFSSIYLPNNSLDKHGNCHYRIMAT